MTILQEYAHNLNSQPSVNPQPILSYVFPDALLTRLQREHGWDSGLTLRALDEYRRFVVLAASAPQPVTPSRVVDGVWHTHLMFTRDYWERFMPLLPTPLHHEPGDGTPASEGHFREQYARTLEAYRAAFHQTPPADLWPDPAQAQPSTRRRSTKRPRPRRPALWPGVGAALLAVVLLLLGQSLFLAFFIFVLATLLLTGLARRTPSSAQGGDSGIGFFGVFTDFSSGDSCTDEGRGDSDCGDGGGDSGSCGSSCGGGGCSS